MRYFSIDIETTGLDEEKDTVLEFAAVEAFTDRKEDLESLNKFHCYFKHDRISGQPRALEINDKAIKVISSGKAPEGALLIYPDQFKFEFWYWLESINYPCNDTNFRTKARTLNVAGKNFASFDSKFIKKLFELNPRSIKEEIFFRHRVLDPGPLYMLPEDETVPDFQTCLNRAGIIKETSHTALEDALDTIQLLRYKGL